MNNIVSETLNPRVLPTVHLNGRDYYIDDRLKELRNIHNPHDSIDF